MVQGVFGRHLRLSLLRSGLTLSRDRVSRCTGFLGSVAIFSLVLSVSRPGYVTMYVCSLGLGFGAAAAFRNEA